MRLSLRSFRIQSGYDNRTRLNEHIHYVYGSPEPEAEPEAEPDDIDCCTVPELSDHGVIKTSTREVMGLEVGPVNQ